MKKTLIAYGASECDPKAYPLYTLPRLTSAEDDAKAVAALAATLGFEAAPGPRLREAATAAQFRADLLAALEASASGDLVVVYFAGHGAIYQLGVDDDVRDDDPENPKNFDTQQQFLAFYDRPLLDDELADLYSAVPERAGVQVLVLIDACHGSGMSDSLFEVPHRGDGQGGGAATGGSLRRPMPTRLQRDFNAWRALGRNAATQAGEIVRRTSRMLPYDVAELAVLTNLPAYRRALPLRAWPDTVAEFNDDRFLSPQVRERLVNLTDAVRAQVLDGAFADRLEGLASPLSLDRVTVRGVTRDADVTLPRALPRTAFGVRVTRPFDRIELRAASPDFRPAPGALSNRTRRLKPEERPAVCFLSVAGDYAVSEMFTRAVIAAVKARIAAGNTDLNAAAFARDVEAQMPRETPPRLVFLAANRTPVLTLPTP